MASRWHPILAAVEREPGSWDMVDPMGSTHGHVEIRRTSDDLRYRGELISWAMSLRTACDRIHSEQIHSVAPAKGREALGQYQ